MKPTLGEPEADVLLLALREAEQRMRDAHEAMRQNRPGSEEMFAHAKAHFDRLAEHFIMRPER